MLSVAESRKRLKVAGNPRDYVLVHRLPGLKESGHGGRLTGLLFLSVNDSLRTGYCVYSGGWLWGVGVVFGCLIACLTNIFFT